MICHKAIGDLYYDVNGNAWRAQVFVEIIGDMVHSALPFDDFPIMA